MAMSRRGAANCGIDYFISGDDIMITEINARWTGRTLSGPILAATRRVNQPAVAFFDMVDCQDRDALEAFQREHLYAPGGGWRFFVYPHGVYPV